MKRRVDSLFRIELSTTGMCHMCHLKIISKGTATGNKAFRKSIRAGEMAVNYNCNEGK